MRRHGGALFSRLTLLHQAGLFVVFHCARVQRRRKAVLDHLFFFQVLEGRMEFLELVKVFEYRSDHVVDGIIRDLGRGNEGGADAEGLGVGVGSAIHAAGNGRSAVIGVFLDQLVNLRPGDFH